MKSWPPSASPPSAFGRAATRGTPRRSRRSVPPRRGGPRRGAARPDVDAARAARMVVRPSRHRGTDETTDAQWTRAPGIRSVRRGRRSRPRATGSTPRSRGRFARRTFGRRRIQTEAPRERTSPRGRHAVDPHDGDDARGDAGARVRGAPRVGPRGGASPRARRRARVGCPSLRRLARGPPPPHRGVATRAAVRGRRPRATRRRRPRARGRGARRGRGRRPEAQDLQRERRCAPGPRRAAPARYSNVRQAGAPRPPAPRPPARATPSPTRVPAAIPTPPAVPIEATRRASASRARPRSRPGTSHPHLGTRKARAPDLPGKHAASRHAHGGGRRDIFRPGDDFITGERFSARARLSLRSRARSRATVLSHALRPIISPRPPLTAQSTSCTTSAP